MPFCGKDLENSPSFSFYWEHRPWRKGLNVDTNTFILIENSRFLSYLFSSNKGWLATRLSTACLLWCQEKSYPPSKKENNGVSWKWERKENMVPFCDECGLHKEKDATRQRTLVVEVERRLLQKEVRPWEDYRSQGPDVEWGWSRRSRPYCGAIQSNSPQKYLVIKKIKWRGLMKGVFQKCGRSQGINKEGWSTRELWKTLYFPKAWRGKGGVLVWALLETSTETRIPGWKVYMVGKENASRDTGKWDREGTSTSNVRPASDHSRQWNSPPQHTVRCDTKHKP